MWLNSLILCLSALVVAEERGREGGMEGRREGGMEGRRDGGTEGGRDGGREGGTEGGREGGRGKFNSRTYYIEYRETETCRGSASWKSIGTLLAREPDFVCGAHLKVSEGIVYVSDRAVCGGLGNRQGAGSLGLGQVHLELKRKGKKRRDGEGGRERGRERRRENE